MSAPVRDDVKVVDDVDAGERGAVEVDGVGERPCPAADVQVRLVERHQTGTQLADQ